MSRFTVSEKPESVAEELDQSNVVAIEERRVSKKFSNNIFIIYVYYICLLYMFI
jgi:hypothetical protein